MKRRCDLVDQYNDSLNYDRGFRHYLMTGWDGYLSHDIQSDDSPDGTFPVGKKNAGGVLLDADSHEIATTVWARGLAEARGLCDEWAKREEWRMNHVCPLQYDNIQYLGDKHVPMYPCIGVKCAYWNWWHGTDGPCMLVREPSE